MLFSRRTKLFKMLAIFLFLGFLVVAAPATAPAAGSGSSSGADNACLRLVYQLSADPEYKYDPYTYRLVSSSPAKKYYYYYPETKIIRIYYDYNGRYPVITRESQRKPQSQPQPQFKPEPQPQPQHGPIKGLTADEQRMVELVNKERAAAGLPALKVNPELVKVARLKAQDMVVNDYFSHTSPTYGSPFAIMKQFGISYCTAGENLAGAPDVEMAHKNLMNSPGHRANILNGFFTQVGIGVAEGSPYGKIFVQMFIG